ncbi:MAG: MFS transporter [Elusimicrobia bacterium]|nr:MFS transporter [Elusimicrobiota bacterium]
MTPLSLRPGPRFSWSFWTLVAAESLLVTGAALSFPFLAVYLTVHRGLSAGLVGAFLSASMFSTAVAHGIGGEWSDVAGRKRVMIASLSGRSAATVLMAWVIWSRQHHAWIMLLHLTGMFLGAFFTPAARSWVADTTDPQRRVRAYGFLRMGSNLGWALGPAIGGALALKSYSMMFLFTALAFAGSALTISLGVLDSPRSRHEEGMDFKAALSTLADSRFARLCICSLLIGMVMSQLVVALSLHCVRYLHMPESRVGVLFSINGIIVVLLQFWASKGLERSRLTSGLTLGCLFYGAGYLGVGFSPGFETAALAVSVLTLGEILVQPGQHTLAANIAPESHKGRYLGVHGILQQVGASLGILLGGAGNEYLAPLWPPLPWCLVACVALAAGLGFRSLAGRVTTEQDGKIPSTPLQELPV